MEWVNQITQVFFEGEDTPQKCACGSTTFHQDTTGEYYSCTGCGQIYHGEAA